MSNQSPPGRHPDDQPGEGQAGSTGGQTGGQQVHLSVNDETKRGEYANFLAVSHSPHEFTLDFCQLQPTSSTETDVNAEVVTRVRIPPTLAGKVIQALNTNMTAYEDKYGAIRSL